MTDLCRVTQLADLHVLCTGQALRRVRPNRAGTSSVRVACLLPFTGVDTGTVSGSGLVKSARGPHPVLTIREIREIRVPF